jgi:IclR family transcriptional regulator, pca regulon regulatory protein
VQRLTFFAIIAFIVKSSRPQKVVKADQARTRKPSESVASELRGPHSVLPALGLDAGNGDPNFMTSLARGLAVIRAFTEQRRRLTIAQISHRTGIPRAAARRCLYTLEKLGYVESDAHTFSLRPKILSVGHAYLSSTPLAVSAQPVLDRVRDAVNQSCSLAILDGDDILYLARSATARIMSLTLNVGSRLPAYCTAMGRVLLAYVPKPELDAYLARVELRAFVDRTITSPEKLRQLLDVAREAGYALVDQELEVGLRSIAVPVRSASGAVVAGVNVSVHAGFATPRQMETRFLPHLRSAALELGTALHP